jgi:hypothetical protein
LFFFFLLRHPAELACRKAEQESYRNRSQGQRAKVGRYESLEHRNKKQSDYAGHSKIRMKMPFQRSILLNQS